MKEKGSNGFVIPFAAMLLAVAVSVSQEPDPGSKPDLPPIPAIPGVPPAKGTRPAPSQPAPGLAMPGFTIPGISGAAASRPERIRPEFQPGSTYRFVVKTELEDANGGGFTLEHQVRYDARVRVDGKPGVVLKGRTERLDLVLVSRGATISYQSLKPEDQETPLGRHLRANLNRSVDLTLDPRGRIDAVKEGGAGDTSAVIAGVPSIGPEELAQWITCLTQGYPDKPVGPGDEWTFRGSRSIGGTGIANFEIGYRHDGPAGFEGNTCVAINCSGTLAGALPGADESVPPSGFQASSLRGRIFFDPLDHMVRFAEQKIELWINQPPAGLPVPDSAGTSTGTDLPTEPTLHQVSVRETTTVRLLHVIPTP